MEELSMLAGELIYVPYSVYYGKREYRTPVLICGRFAIGFCFFAYLTEYR